MTERFKTRKSTKNAIALSDGPALAVNVSNQPQADITSSKGGCASVAAGQGGRNEGLIVQRSRRSTSTIWIEDFTSVALDLHPAHPGWRRHGRDHHAADTEDWARQLDGGGHVALHEQGQGLRMPERSVRRMEGQH